MAKFRRIIKNVYRSWYNISNFALEPIKNDYEGDIVILYKAHVRKKIKINW